MPNSFESSIPVEFAPSQVMEDGVQTSTPTTPPSSDVPTSPAIVTSPSETANKVRDYVIGWRNQLRTQRQDKLTIWNECWELYRGQEDWSDKEDWQTKIVLPKTWSSIKQATNVIKRFLTSAKQPWSAESINPDDIVTVVRAEQVTDLVQVFLDQAHYIEEFAVGLECGFIVGLGAWKIWWGLVPRQRIRVVTGMVGEDGRFVESPQGNIKQTVREEVLEGRLFVRAVDPYNFYWLPGSKLNRWTGTIEEVEIPKWELMEMASKGVFDKEKIAALGAMKIDEQQKQSWTRWGERSNVGSVGPVKGAEIVKLTEFYGPIIIDGEVVEKNGHVVIANDQVMLLPAEEGWQKNGYWHQKAPYVGFSPLGLPFRTEGVGLIEQVRAINKSLNRLANLSVDTLLFRLLPVFEVTPEVYENPEDFETGMVPGKVFRRTFQNMGTPGINPVEFQDVSQGSVAVAGMLDRAFQEGALVSEIQQAIPRYRGYQSATEIDAKVESQNGFFGSMATDIEKQAIAPAVEMAIDLMLQFINTANDPRVASILGVGQDVLRGMTREELLEIVQGDYKIRVEGISGQLEKVEMLQNLVQFMNIIGQNAEAWMPYINQDALLRRILEAFRPAIRDIENIIADPTTVESVKAASQSEKLTPEMLRMLPQLVDMATQAQKEEGMQQQAQQAQALQQQQLAFEGAMKELELKLKQLEVEAAEIANKQAKQSTGE